MKKSIALILILTSVFVLSSCGSSYKSDMVGGKQENETSLSPAPMANYDSGAYDANEEYYFNGEAERIISYSDKNTSDEIQALPTGNNPQEAARKIIRDAYMDIEAENASLLYASLSAYCKFLGGYEFQTDIQNYEEFSVIQATLKIPPEKLDDFMTYAGENGKIINSKINSNDVTDNYYDMKTRVEIKRRSLESYYKLLENAENLSSIISLQRTIDGIIEDIESYEGKIRVLDSLSEMATVRLLIKQENDPEPIEEVREDVEWDALDADDMGYFIKSGFISVVNFFVSIFQWLIIALAVASPIWIPIGIITFIIIVRNKKKRKRMIAERMNTIPNQKTEEQLQENNPPK
ncbi:MAG: DUF4349 domain-containing protein [Oscillospiraceae bacterium]|nr:DUF4349 domain-containing protein [Oscillospiraceae bacterium]